MSADAHSSDAAQQRGRTADGAALGRAAHRRYARPVVFDDPWAERLLSPPLRWAVRLRPVWWLALRPGMRPFQNILAVALGSFRYAETQIEAAVARGVDQLLVVGAGLDSFALRRADLAPKLRVFELDHPATQALKRARIARALPALPPHLELVPIDFETTSIEQALASSGFDPQRPAFATWLNTTPYLTEDAIFATLDGLARVLAPGSELVFNYAVTPEHLEPADLATLRELGNYVKRRGEPFRSAFDPDVFPQRVCERGYRLVAQLSMADLHERYFAGRTDGMRPALGGRLAHFATTGTARAPGGPA